MLNLIIRRIYISIDYIISLLNSKFKFNNDIILIPPTVLNGSFGDELMVVSFLNNFKEKNIILYTEQIIERDDLFRNYTNLKYGKWNNNLIWYKFSEIYLLGADNLSGTYGNKEVEEKIKILKKANFFNKKVEILGFSLSKSITSEVQKMFNEIKSFTKFKMRDPDSFDRANKIILSPKNIIQVADLAFSCPLISCENDDYITWIKNQKNEDRIIIAICPNSIHMRKYNDEEYINQYVDFIKQINNSGKYSFVLLYHDLRELNENWNDMLISKELYSILKSYNNVYFTDKIINGVQLKSYLSFVDLTITSRMHFGISGYSLGKPMLGITYENKFSGLQKLFEISPERSLIDYTDLNNLFKIFETFMDDYHKNCKLIQKNLPNILKLSKKNFE